MTATTITGLATSCAVFGSGVQIVDDKCSGRKTTKINSQKAGLD
jgi:hypothetical protein